MDAAAELDPRAAQAEMLRQASQSANRLNTLAAVAQMANNPGAAKAMQLAQKSQQGQYTPEKMGQQGFMLPNSGQFVESPMYVDEKNAARDARQSALEQSLQAKKELQAQRLTDAQRHDEQMAALRQSLLAQTLAARAANRPDPAEKAAAKADAETEKGVTKFSATLEKAGIPELESALSQAEARLGMHKLGELPGYGRFEGVIPDWAATGEQQQSRSDMQAAANIILKSRSGAAVTEPEQQRFLREVATGKGMSEEAMRHGWASLRKNFDIKKGNLVASANDAVLGEYNKRSPLQLSRGKAAGAAGAGSPPAGVTAAEWAHMSPEDRKLFQ